MNEADQKDVSVTLDTTVNDDWDNQKQVKLYLVSKILSLIYVKNYLVYIYICI